MVSLSDCQLATLAELRSACYDGRWPKRPAWVRTRHLATPRRSPFLRVLLAKGLVDRRDPEDAAVDGPMREFFWRINKAGEAALGQSK